MKELLLSRPTEISAHDLHKQVYDLCAGAGQPRKFIYGDFGAVVVVRGDLPQFLHRDARDAIKAEPNQEYSFVLRAYPTVKFGNKRRSIGASPAKDDLRLRWIERRARERGFELIGTPLMTVQAVTINKNGRAFGFNAVTYEGRLRVTDAEALNAALVAGIGQGRAYGCGFMIINRIA